MLIRHLVTIIIATISLYLSFQATKALTCYNFGDIFETIHRIDLFEDYLNALKSVLSFEPAATSNAENSLGDAHSSSFEFSTPSSSSSDSPRASPTSSTSDSPQSLASATKDPAPTKSVPTATGHSGRIFGIGLVILSIFFWCFFWLKRRLRPPPEPDPPPLNPHVLWPGTWIGNFPSACAPTTPAPARRRSNRLPYFSPLPPKYIEDGDLEIL